MPEPRIPCLFFITLYEASESQPVWAPAFAGLTGRAGRNEARR